ncbi:MAG: hypothetical protein J6X01_04090 [Bacteroidales bacterium]|nr:hypothetical protein [Bacteroidales bacterium]
MKFSKITHILNALIFVLLFIWQLPQNLVAIAILLFSKTEGVIAYRHYCFALKTRMPKMAGGVSLGSFALISPSEAQNERTVRHELDGHTVDSKILGPLYLLVIGLPSALHLLFYKGRRSYDDFYTERWANKHAGLLA